MKNATPRGFNIVSRLFAGTNADLFLAYWSDGDGPFVVKALRDFGNLDARRAFSNQFRVLRNRHPGALPLISSDVETMRPHYLVPYASRGTLAQYAGRLDDSQVRRVALRLAQTLASMHRSIDLHGDLKPDNVLVDAAGELWLADPFGNPMPLVGWLARNCGGTLGYRAPEVTAGASISPQADVYSFGATLWHLVTGRRPDDRIRLDETIAGWTDDAHLRDLIGACCNPSPGERPTMDDVLCVLNGETWQIVKNRRDATRAAIIIVLVVGAILLTASVLKDPQSS